MENFSKTESEDSDNEILLPINSIFPPNEIITKKYAPDVKPSFKLIVPDKKERRKVTLPSEAPPSYWQLFQEADTLGFEYSSIRSKLVYLRFNNSNYMKLTGQGKAVKYFAGMFVPLDKLLSQSLKKTKNIYKVLPSFEFIDNRYPYESSFSTNCYSNDPCLRFSSNYQGSNLFAALKVNLQQGQVGQAQYDLILQNDINSKGNTQWFNFTVQIFQERNYKFNIVNLTKSSSLYQKGMNIAYHSQTNKINNRIGWTKGCHSISYQSTGVIREGCYDNTYYSLHFQYKSPYKNDIVNFSYSFPYTLIDLEKFFNKVMVKRSMGNLKIDRIKIAETLTGFPLYVYSFTPKKYQSKKNLCSSQTITDNNANQGIPSVIFMARQHPGQSQGSYVAEGVVEWLLEGEYDSWKKHYNFYVVPMVNLDGVFYGNYRTNLSGNDLNRVWRQPRKDYHCQIYSLKKFLSSLNKSNPISLIIDIHGHSNSLNSFFYGNPPKKQSQNPKLFPYYCSRKIKQISFAQSTFKVSEDKKACARVVLSEMFPKAYIYTFENSFYGWRKGKIAIEHSIQSYKKLGRDLVQCYVQFSRLCEKNPGVKDRWVKEIQELTKEGKEYQQEICSQSDGEIDNELIEFQEASQGNLDLSLSPQQSVRYGDKKKSMPSIGKNNFLKYIKRHSPLKLKNYCTANDTYFLQKSPDRGQDSQGFLSIVKINTKSYIDSSPSDKKIGKSCILQEERKTTMKDLVVEDFYEDASSSKENQSNVKVSKLITEKQMIKEKLRQNRKKIEDGMLHTKTYNGFFRYNYIKKT